MSSLHIRNLHYTINDGSTDRTILENINLDIASGEVLGLTGPSGSGKSSLLALLGCLSPITSGSARLTLHDSRVIDLHTAHGSQAARIRRDYIGIMFQQPNLIPSLTAKEQLHYMARIQGRRINGRIRTEAMTMLEKVGLAEKANLKVGQLSGGEQARINAARAIFSNPQLLLADEPTAALDTSNARALTILIHQLAHENNIPTLFISHDQEQLALLDRNISLVDGHLKEKELSVIA